MHNSRLAALLRKSPKPLAVMGPQSGAASAPPAAAPPAAAPQQVDSVEAGLHPINKFEKGYRLWNAGGIQLALGDFPAVVSMVANSVNMPWLSPFLGVVNTINAATGYIGINADLRVNYDALKNPHATKLDKFIDWSHFVVGDLINTGASMVPLFVSMSNPLAYGIFMGGQGVGIAADIAKFYWDKHRNGQQSALPDANAPHRMVLDPIESGFNRLAHGVSLLGSEAMLIGHFLSPVVAGVTAGFGGAMSVIGGANQLKKSRDYTKRLEAEQKQGATKTEFPLWTKQGLLHKDVPIEEALKITRQRKWASAAQILAGTAVLVASVAAAPLAVGIGLGLTVATAVGGAVVDVRAQRRLSQYEDHVKPLVLPEQHEQPPAPLPVDATVT